MVGNPATIRSLSLVVIALERFGPDEGVSLLN
jgi:hypothetical protein